MLPPKCWQSFNGESLYLHAIDTGARESIRRAEEGKHCRALSHITDDRAEKNNLWPLGSQASHACTALRAMQSARDATVAL